MQSTSFYPGFRDTSDLWDRLSHLLSREISRMTLPWHHWYEWVEHLYSMSAVQRDMERDTSMFKVAHSLSAFSLVRAEVNSETRLILLNPALNPTTAIVNMYNVYNRKTQTDLGSILGDTWLYKWLVWDKVIWNPEEFQKDLADSLVKKDALKRTLESISSRCVVLINPNDKIIDWQSVIEDFWDYIEMGTYQSPQKWWVISGHVPQLWESDFKRMKDFLDAA